MKNIAEEEATRPGAGYLPAGFRLSAQITPGRPGRDADPEVAQGVRPVAAAPRSRRSRALPARRDGPRGVGEGLRPARDIRDPPPAPRCAPRRVAPAPRPAPCLLCRQRAAARQRARSPSEVPRCFLLRLGRGLMSKPGATRAGHGLPGGAGLAVRCLCRRSCPPPLSFSGSCKSPRARCR